MCSEVLPVDVGVVDEPEKPVVVPVKVDERMVHPRTLDAVLDLT